MLGNDCFNCGCTPVKCRMPNELLMTVKGFNYSWSNTPAGAGADVPSLSERTKCGPCVSPGIITCGDENCCPDATSRLCNQDEGCCGSRAEGCDPPPVNSMARTCCTWSPLGAQDTCSVQYFCNCVHDNSRKHRWPRDQWTGAPMCETSGHPICGQYSHLCQQPPEPVAFVREGFLIGFEDGRSACTHTTFNTAQGEGTGWGRLPENRLRAFYTPQCEKWSREFISGDGFDPDGGPYADLTRDTAGNLYWSGYRSLHGSTNLYAPDLNSRPFVLHRIYDNAQPRLRPLVSRSRTPPANLPLIDAQLLFDMKPYPVWRAELAAFTGAGLTEFNAEEQEIQPVDPLASRDGNWIVWRVDYPCLPEYGPSECAGEPGGIVAPKLRAFSNGASGLGAVITHVLQPVSNPVEWDPGPDPETVTWQYPRVTEGYVDNGSMWCVSGVSISDNGGGTGYKVDDEFYFDFYETPARGGELRTPISDSYQRARVTAVNQNGAITAIQLHPPPVEGSGCPDYTTTYGRLIGHRKAVSVAGTGYVEGDVLEWNCVDGKPTGAGEFPNTKISLGCRTTQKARATVTEVDCRGGIVDWFMCGAQNVFNYYAPPPPCPQPTPDRPDDRGEYSDMQYLERCVYHYTGFLPVRYSYQYIWLGSGGDDPCDPCCRVGPAPRNYGPGGSKGCGPAYCQFDYTISKVSVQNRVEISEPFPGGSRAIAKITAINPSPREVDSGYACPAKAHNWATYNPDYLFPETIPQGGVQTISLLHAGSGYARENEDGTVETKNVKVKITAIFDPPVLPPWVPPDPADEIWRGRGEFGRNKCQAAAVIDSDPESNTFGQITEITITEPGLYYFAEAHDHVWVATAETKFAPFLDYAPAPMVAPDGTLYDPPEDWDIHNVLLPFRRRRHSLRKNWGRAEHKDGFIERCGTGTTCEQRVNIAYDRDFYEVPPYQKKKLTARPGNDVMGNYAKRWSKKYCPTDLLNIYFDMVWVQHYIPDPSYIKLAPGFGSSDWPIPNSCGTYGVYCAGKPSYAFGCDTSMGCGYDNAGWFRDFTQVWESMDKGPIRFTISNVLDSSGNVTEEAS